MDVLKKRIGIVGGGQLGKMMILEAKRLGFYVVVLDPASDCPASSICDELICESFTEDAGYITLASKVDVITYEFEHINADILFELECSGHLVYPSVRSLMDIKDKYKQKTVLKNANIPVPPFVLVHNIDEIYQLCADACFGLPLMLKTTTGGYDGKGNALIRSLEDVPAAYALLGAGALPLMAEAFVDFTKEISILATRGIHGDRVLYPIAENAHKNSILDVTSVPADVQEAVIYKANEIADNVMDVFQGVGTFCVELFLTKSGDVLVNEVAPRPNNSGHYTIEGCFANQFENHIRAIVGLSLGDTALKQPTVMVNLIGQSAGKTKLLGLEEAYQDPHVHIHMYGKSQSAIGRKMGHYTVVGGTHAQAIQKAMHFKNIIKVMGEGEQ